MELRRVRRVTNKVDAVDAEILRYRYDADDRLTNRWTAAKGDTIYRYDPIGKPEPDRISLSAKRDMPRVKP